MIEVRSLSRYYNDFAALQQIDFQIQSNQVVGFVGRNGAGKSTMLKIIAGLLSPSDGTVLINGVNLEQAQNSLQNQIGFLPEDPPLYVEMTVSEYLRYLGLLRGMTKQQVSQRLPMVIDKCQLADRAHQVISELSLGYRKRVGIAQAIIHAPELVILDEPISGLDPMQIVKMRQLIRSLASEATILLSSHNLHEISETCDRVLFLDQGQISKQGTLDELLQENQNASATIIALLLPNGKDIEQVLSSLSFIKNHKITKTAENLCQLEVSLQDAMPEQLTAALVQAGIGVRSITQDAVELEDAFLSLASGDRQ